MRRIQQESTDFAERTGLPRYATKVELELLGARHFISAEDFPYQGRVARIEQMQLARGTSMYLWKRIISEGEDAPFQVHVEVTPKIIGHYEYVSEVERVA